MSIQSIQSRGLGGQVTVPPEAVRGRRDAETGPDASATAVSAAYGPAEADRVELSPAAMELARGNDSVDPPELHLSPDELRRLASGED